MTRITHVLCPVDFSDISQHALDHAAAIANWYDARLTVFYVFPTLPTMDVPPLVLGDEDRAQFEKALRQMASRVPKKVQVEFAIRDAGFVHDGILAEATATRADLLVLGTHGRSGFQRLFLGSVTEKVIRKTTCPALVVPPRAPDVAADAAVQFKRILCAVDFSDSALSAVQYALTLAEESDAHLTLLHVIEIAPEIRESPWAARIEFDRLYAESATEARRRLEGLVPEEARTYCDVDTTVVDGRASRVILQHAAAQHADLIVVGGHGRGAIEHLLVGSTTHHIIRQAECPVLAIRTP